MRILSPDAGAEVGARVDVEVEAHDPGPVANGIREVRIYAEEQGGSRSASIATLPGPGPTFRASWTLPPCLGPQDRWYVYAEAVDSCSRESLVRVRIKRRSDSCVATSTATAPDGAGAVLAWTSELALPGGRGQVIANGVDVVFPGEAVAVGPETVAFRLQGRPGERAVFGFDAE